MTIEIITVRVAVDADIARVRQLADLIARSFGLESFARTRLVTAVLEIARNALQYAGGGQAKFSVGQHRGKSLLSVKIIDQGKGIEHPEAFKGVRRPYLPPKGGDGLGLGLGLQGVKRLADRFDLISSKDGTRVDMGFFIPVPANELKPRVVAIADDILALGAADPVAELARQNRELAEAMAERELLIDEIHHRTGNNLALIVSFIQMSRRAADLPETRQALSDLEARVHAVARVHQELQRSHSADRVALLPLLENVARHAGEAFSSRGRDIALDVSGEPVVVRSNTAIDLGLIVGELITNAFKHAFVGRDSGRIDIGFEKLVAQESTTGWRVTVSDDGIGFVGGDRPDRPHSLGWRMIRAMCHRYGGTISTDGSSGFTTAITFPPELIEEAEHPERE